MKPNAAIDFLSERQNHLCKIQRSLEKWALLNIMDPIKRDEFVEQAIRWHADTFDDVWNTVQ